MKRKIVIGSGILFSCLLVGFYIFQLNSLTTLAYRIAETEDSLTQIKHEHTTLQQKAYQALSLRDLEQLASERRFVKVNSITYLQTPGGLVAQNQ